MTKAEKIYNIIETINEKGKVIFVYLFVYGFAILFILIGILIMMIPANPPDYPKWFLILIGIPFSLLGFTLLLMAIKFLLEGYVYE